MEIKCNNYPIKSKLRYAPELYVNKPCATTSVLVFNESRKGMDIRPVASKSATGLNVINKTFYNIYKSISNVFHNYSENIKHTYEHKIYFSIIEKQLFGKNSIDSITHDTDKLLLYILGFSHDFVTSFHRKHSEHHTDSKKAKNFRSMLVDNIASSPAFKPDKKLSFRDHFYRCRELQEIRGLEEFLKQYNFGENLDFEQIKRYKALNIKGLSGLKKVLAKALSIFLHH